MMQEPDTKTMSINPYILALRAHILACVVQDMGGVRYVPS